VLTSSSPNPYQAPAEHEPLPPGDGAFVVAGRWRRLVGGLVDCVVNTSVFFAWQMALVSPGSTAWFLFMGPIYFATTSTPLVLQAALIARSGQSVGKLVTRTRMVLSNGGPAGLLRGFLLRTFPFAMVFFSPWVLVGTGMVKESATLEGCTSLILLIDVLIIFRTGNRCLHDHIAGTFVSLTTPPPAGEAAVLRG
jgi:uncharacterized RDD family membrane protein YckC